MTDQPRTHSLRNFWAVWWQPPRKHGDHDDSRSVSFLELFYDLVFVVLVAQAAHSLAHHITWRSVGEFVVVFGLIWAAWLNGTLYQDLHGRADGRSRTAIFVQMMIIAPLAVFTPYAAGKDSAEFAVTYSLLMLVIMWLWWSVRRIDDEQYHRLTAGYIGGQALAVGCVIGSIFLPEQYRAAAWAGYLAVFVASSLMMPRTDSEAARLVLRGAHSTTERFDLFTIIVLGEVIVGIVAGMSDAEHTARVIATGVLGMVLAFGVWWTYFDFVGARLPADRPHLVIRWTFLHMPLTMAIAALGAGLVSLVEHTADAHTPTSTSWLVGGALAATIATLAFIYPTLGDYAAHRTQYRRLIMVSLVTIAAVLAIAAWQPAPTVFVVLCGLLLATLWTFMVVLWVRGSSASKISWPPDINAVDSPGGQ